MASGQANADVGIDQSTTLTLLHEQPIVVGPICAHSKEHGHAMTTQQAAYAGHLIAHALTAEHDASEDGTGRGVATSYAVRRLTPRECERLQGFPDDYTLIPFKGKPAADGPRYRALGNSMAVPVMHWIGRRIQAAQDALQKKSSQDARSGEQKGAAPCHTSKRCR